jgi:hypothetical protein
VSPTVPFHLELHASGLREAHAFNLSEVALRGQVLDPWLRGETIELGDRRWDPENCRLTVLEGPHLDPADLSYGQGWNNARKRSRDVTATVVAPPASAAPATPAPPAASTADAVAVLGPADPMRGFLIALGLRPVEWEVVRAELLALAAVAGPAAPAALGATAAVVVLGGDRPPPFDLGLALGALGGRAILTRVGETHEAPELGELSAIRLDAGGAAPLHALAQRLRAAGCAVEPSQGWDAPERFS